MSHSGSRNEFGQVTWLTGKDLLFSPGRKHDLRFPPALPLLVYGYAFSPHFHITPNSHDYLEVCHIVEGTGTALVGDLSYRIAPGDTLVLNDREFHLVEAAPERDLRVVCVFFLPELVYQPGAHLSGLDFLNPFHRRPKDFSNRIDAASKHAPALHSAVLTVSRATNRSSPLHRLDSLHALYGLLLELNRACGPAPADTSPGGARDADRARLRPVFDVVHANYERHITREELARAACVSPSYLVRLFKRITGTTVSGYIVRYRIDRAKELLAQQPGMSVSQVAYAVGFSSHSYFDRAFRRLVHTTPQRFRAECQR
ncbi:MAG: helix-turn-helix domain-containing protein [Chitinivibrionales bacterium]|nr:helix-turn-helix domain-containing protein [Chitinivibrionales bacterium]